MIEDLNKEQLELAEFMSELSEKAYNAGWMHNLEFELWEAMNNRKTKYGMLVITKQILETLIILSNKAGGWIIFDQKREEVFLNWKEWNELSK